MTFWEKGFPKNKKIILPILYKFSLIINDFQKYIHVYKITICIYIRIKFQFFILWNINIMNAEIIPKNTQVINFLINKI